MRVHDAALLVTTEMTSESYSRNLVLSERRGERQTDESFDMVEVAIAIRRFMSSLQLLL